MDNFIKQILANLESNGFPDKKVSLPTEKMYEVADSKGLSLNTALDKLKEVESIQYEIGDETIVFEKTLTIVESENLFDTEGMPDVEMMGKAQDMLSKMDPAELKKMQDMFTNMSDEEKANLMQKGKDMGFIK